MRLIDANALREKLKKHHDFFTNAWGGFHNLPAKDKARVDEITHCIAEIMNAPTIDPESLRPQGEWFVLGQDVFCTNCDCESGYNAFGASAFSNFCPNCGAKMKGGAD